MPTWLLIAAVATIAVTALLVWLLYRINAPLMAEAKRAENEGEDSSAAGV